MLPINPKSTDIPSIHLINKAAAKSKLNAVSLFSGMGGGSIGLKLAGFNVRYANEFIPAAADTYEKNSLIKVDRLDVRKVTAKRIRRMSGLGETDIDIIEASPPCKTFSAAQARKKGGDFGQVIAYSDGVKQRVDDLFFEFTRLLQRLQSKVFIAENVPGLLNAINRGHFLEIYQRLQDCGYHIEASIIDPSWLGLPQQRKRLIFVGIRNDVYAAGFKHVWPAPYKKQTTVAECLPHIEQIKTTKGYMTAKVSSPTITAADHSIGETAQFSCGAFIATKDGATRKYTIEELKVLSSVPTDFEFARQPNVTDKKHFITSWIRLGRIHAPISVYHIASLLRQQVIEPFKALNLEKPNALRPKQPTTFAKNGRALHKLKEGCSPKI